MGLNKKLYFFDIKLVIFRSLLKLKRFIFVKFHSFLKISIQKLSDKHYSFFLTKLQIIKLNSKLKKNFVYLSKRFKPIGKASNDNNWIRQQRK